MKRRMLWLVILFLASCGERSDKTIELPPAKLPVDASRAHWQAGQEPITLQWYINFDWFDGGNGEDLLSKEIARRTGIEIDFIKGNDDRLNQMIASASLPDLITVDGNAKQFTESASRWAVPLNQLADAYDPYFYRVANADTLRWFTDNAGNVYGYPSYSNAPEHFASDWMGGSSAFLVRKDIYQAIGSPNMQTPEGFLSALKKAQAYDPSLVILTGTNLKDGGSLLDPLMNFLAIPQVINGERNERLLDSDYLEWMEVLRQAYQEGFIIDDEFAGSRDNLEENIVQGRYFALFTDGIVQFNGTLVRNFNRNPNQQYIAVDGPTNRAGDAPQLQQSGIGGWTRTFITKDAKDKERAIALMTFLISDEGQALLHFGVENETYFIDEDGYYQLTQEVLALRSEDNNRFKSELRLGELWMLGHDAFKLKHSNDAPEAMVQIYDWARGKAYPNFLLETTDPDPKTPEDRILQTYIAGRNTLAVNMIRAKSNEEMLNLVHQFIAEMDRAGFARVKAIIDQNIKKNQQRLA